MISPIRTRSPDTVTLARSTGAAMTSSRICAEAAAGKAASMAVARRRERRVGTLFLLPPPNNPGLPGLRFTLRKSGRPDLRWGRVGVGGKPQAPAFAVRPSPPLPRKGGESRPRSAATAGVSARRAVARKRERSVGTFFLLPPPNNPGLPGLRFILRKSGRPDLRWGRVGVGGKPQAPACAVPPSPPLPRKGGESRLRFVAAVRIIISSIISSR